MDEDIDFFKKKFNVSRETVEKLKIYIIIFFNIINKS